MRLIQIITDYIALKKSMGRHFRTDAKILMRFCRAAGNIEISKVEPGDVLDFIRGKGPVTIFWHQKFNVLKRFYRFAMARNYASSSPLPTVIPKRPQAFSPHIYTTEEIRKMIEATEILKNPKDSPLQALTFRTLFLTLYGTGLRISEALSLTLSQVKLSESLLVVECSKFYKTRLVPIGPQLTNELCSYREKRCQLPLPKGKDSAFFATRPGNSLHYNRVGTIFRVLRQHAKIHRKDESGCPPRIHDLRHSFAVHRLVSWYREGKDVQRLLPQLSTYLGHVDISQTQHYLSMTPELLCEANKRFEQYTLSEVHHA